MATPANGIWIDRDRANVVFARLLARQSTRGYPYSLPSAVPPHIEENLPKNLRVGSVAHARYLFTLCYWMRGGIQSDTAAKRLARLHEQRPSLFVPTRVIRLRPETITRWLRSVGLGYQSEEIGRHWISNARKLQERYGGSPIALFEGVMTYEEACERIQNQRGNGFKGFQEKMVSMLIYFLLDAGFIPHFPHPIPVDFHVLRILTETEVLKSGPDPEGTANFYQPKTMAEVRALVQTYCVEQSVDPRDLCNALWFFSRIMCNKHPGNASIVEQGKKDRTRWIKPVPYRWSKAKKLTYARTCGRCPLEEHCAWSIPSAPYYVWGRLNRRGARAKPQQVHLYLEGDLKT